MVASSANRRQYATILEAVVGTTPATPRMRTKLVTSDSLSIAPTFTDSNELRSDRMTSDSVMVGLDNGGASPWELHYPTPESYVDYDIRGMAFNDWTLTPVRDNDGTADSTITDIGTVANTVTVLTSAGTPNNSGAFVIGHLVRTSGFASANNNTIARVSTGGATSYVATGSGYTAEAAPPAAARVKVVGFQGASADITATATGLASTALNFTTLGLIVGMAVKIGGTAAGNRFTVNAANNARVRIIAIAANALTLDNLPAGWGVDAGTGKTISVFFGDHLINGSNIRSQTIETGDLGLASPQYIVHTGMIPATWTMAVRPKAIITGTTSYMGMGYTTAPVSGTPLDATIDAAPAQTVSPQFAGSAHVGRLTENGATVGSPNWVTAFDLSVANNITPVESIDAMGPQDLVPGEATITGTINTTFGDASILNRFFAATATNFTVALQRNSQMFVVHLPRVILTGDGAPNAGGKNQLVDVGFSFRASKDDVLTNAMLVLNRMEYVET